MPRVMAEQEVRTALEQSTLLGQTVDGVRPRKSYTRDEKPRVVSYYNKDGGKKSIWVFP